MRERRVSEREREAAVARLKPRLVDGRLSTETFSVRVERAYSARTRSELRRLFDDLPGIRARLSELRESVFGARVAELRLPDMANRVELTIGRADDCDLVLDDPTISRHHAVLRRIPGGWCLRDAGSLNGIRVNGWRIDEARIRPGDELALGEARFVVGA